MFWFYILKEIQLAKRNMLFLLLVILPILTSFAGAASIDVYSETPKILLLEKDGRDMPRGVKVIYMSDEDSVYNRVYDIDSAIGIVKDKIIIDGRESEDAVAAAESIAAGSVPDSMGKMPEDTRRRILSFSLFSAYMAACALIFKMVEERECNTVDLYKTAPSPDIYPIGAKILVSALLGSLGFAISAWILKTPADFMTIILLYFLGTGLGTVLSILTGYFAKNSSQAIALLKPVALFLVILPPAFGLFFGGIFHKVALITPFYWLIQLIYSTYNGTFSLQYFTAIIVAITTGFGVIIFTWHKSPYGRKRSNA